MRHSTERRHQRRRPRVVPLHAHLRRHHRAGRGGGSTDEDIHVAIRWPRRGQSKRTAQRLAIVGQPLAMQDLAARDRAAELERLRARQVARVLAVRRRRVHTMFRARDGDGLRRHHLHARSTPIGARGARIRARRKRSETSWPSGYRVPRGRDCVGVIGAGKGSPLARLPGLTQLLSSAALRSGEDLLVKARARGSCRFGERRKVDTRLERRPPAARGDSSNAARYRVADASWRTFHLAGVQIRPGALRARKIRTEHRETRRLRSGADDRSVFRVRREHGTQEGHVSCDDRPHHDAATNTAVSAVRHRIVQGEG